MYAPNRTDDTPRGPSHEALRPKAAEHNVFMPLVQRSVHYSQQLDSFRRYLTDTPSPNKIRLRLREVDEGDLAAMVEIGEEIEAKDLHLQGVAARRREALTALDWHIDPDDEDDKTAVKMAEYCEEQLRRVTADPAQEVMDFDGALDHMATAIGPGLAAFENLWFRARPIGFVAVPGDRFTAPISGKPDVRVLTEDHQVEGIRASSPKFVVHTPHLRSGFQMRVTLIRATAWLWCIKHYAIADWAAFSERFGAPWRDVTYQGSITPEEREQTQAAIRDMGNDAWFVHSDKLVMTLLEANRASQPFNDLVQLCDNKMSIGWLGQTLTTEQQSVGSLALGDVHANVKASIGRSDMKGERATIRAQLLAPMCWFRFPDVPRETAPIPHFRRQMDDTRDLDADRAMLEKFKYMDEKLLPVANEFVYESLGIPIPKEDEGSANASM